MKDRLATRALVLGLLALPFGVLAPFAIWAGARSLRSSGSASALIGLAAGTVGAFFLVAGVAYWWLAS